MESPLIQLLVLAGIAVFLILRLKNVLGTREGFEKPPQPKTNGRADRSAFEVIEGAPDRDITDHVDEDSSPAKALSAMKRVEPSFSVSDFLQGGRGAYEMILMGFERGELDSIQPFMSEEIFDSFVEAVAHREDQGLTIEAQFIGLSETTVVDAKFDESQQRAEITMRFIAELTSVVRDRGGDIVEGDSKTIKRQKDTCTFARNMGADDPNWLLIATEA